jgi:putative DNA primase/helicase
MHELTVSFSQAISDAGLEAPADIIADGKLHRFSSNGKRGDDSGWYVLHDDGVPAGSFGCWRIGLTQNWCAKSENDLDPSERQAMQARIKAAQAQRDAELQTRRAKASESAASLWAQAQPVAQHTYLTAKGVEAYGLRQHQGSLLIPMRADGVLHSLQTINADGEKRFLPGGRVMGCYFAIGKTAGAKALCICEGYATGASIHAATGLPVAVAFNAGNLLNVANAMRAKLPHMRLIVCGDDDCRTEGNPGKTKAAEAAKAVDGVLAIPEFGDSRPKNATDFNDLAKEHGREAVAKLINQALEPPTSPAAECDGVILHRGDQIQMRAVDWLWNGFLPAGMLAVLAGEPGCGKTTIALSLAATVTKGGVWPDGSLCGERGDAIVWSGEDDPAVTLIPRLSAEGAELSRVHFVSGVLANGAINSFDPARDLAGLKAKFSELPAPRLLIVDPIVNAVSGDGHKSNDVRRGLQPLVDLAQTHGCAVLGVSHFSKGTANRDPVERVTGSLAYGALARLVLVAAKGKDEPETADGQPRVFMRAKSNIGPDEGGFVYHLERKEVAAGIEGQYVRWAEPIEGKAREVLGEAESSFEANEGGALADAKQFLIDLLTGGPVLSKEVQTAARGAGIAWATVRRAKQALEIETVKQGGHFGATKQQWLWQLRAEKTLKVLKNPEDAHQKEVSTFSKNEHLQGETPASEVVL